MKAAKNGKSLFEQGRKLEQAGELAAAAAAYQQVVDADAANRDAVARLLIVYRRLKEYGRELAVVEAALNAVAERDKTAQQEWIRSHPGAAKIGMSVLRKLGGESATAFGTDPEVEKLLKRKAFLEKRVGTKKAAAGHRKNKIAAAAGGQGKKKRSAAAATRKEAANKKRQDAAAARKAAVDARKAAVDARKAAAEKKRREAEEKKRREAAQREAAREAAERKAAREAAERKAAREAAREQARKEKEAKAQPSLFVVSLRYLVVLERIDAAMGKHVAFLDKHFKAGDFLVSGRQEPRTGGIIIARAKTRAAIERIMRQDPFVRGKLASVDIVEFKAGKIGRGLEGAFGRGRR